jgi:hypothetical protein
MLTGPLREQREATPVPGASSPKSGGDTPIGVAAQASREVSDATKGR